MNQQMYSVKYAPAAQIEEYDVNPKKKYTRLFLIISMIYLILIFFFTLIIYSSLYGHEDLYDKHHRVMKNLATVDFSTSTGSCTLKDSKKIDAIRNYHQDEHSADFAFCYIILILCIFSFFIWVLVFISRGKKGGLNSKGAISFLVFLFFLIIAATITYFIFFMCQGEDNIDDLKRIDDNLEKLLRKNCNFNLGESQKISLDYIQGYINSIVDIIRPFVIVNFIASCIYFLIWIGLLGAAASKQSLCHPH